MTADDLCAVELGLKTIIGRIDAIQAITRDLQHTPELSDEDTKTLDKLEKALKQSVKKDIGD